MLKRIILWFLGLVILLVIGAGVYIYMLDWNQHKAMIESRFSQITGLKARIEGNLKIDLLPAPKFSANLVKFFKPSDLSNPLINVNQISANVDLWKLFDKKFILKSMTLTQMNISVMVKENGELNWNGVGATNINKSGNIEVSFDDVRLANSTLTYEDQKDGTKFEIGNITARVNAPSLKGPYQTDGNFIFNNSEVKFKSNIVKNDQLTINLLLENPSTSSKVTLEGSLGDNAHGSFTFDTSRLQSASQVILGENKLKEHYEYPLYVSFKYAAEADLLKLDNFNLSYGKDTKGSGSIAIKKQADKKIFQANFDMTQFNLNALQNIISDTLIYLKSGQQVDFKKYENLSGTLNLKSGNVAYNGVSANNLNLGITLDNNVINIDRFGLDMPGDSSIKLSGSVDFNNNVNYLFEQSVKTNDLRVLASVFNINLGKLASDDNKKSIFKKADTTLKLSGDLNNLKISIPNATVDSSTIKGNLGFISNEGKVYVLADLQASKVLFDKYVEIIPQSLSDASFENKLVHQFNLIPWDHSLDIDARINIASAVYNKVPLENLLLEVKMHDNTINVEKLSINSLAGATLNLAFKASDIYSKPNFEELSYDIRSSNFPQFSSAMGIDTGNYGLFNRKLFASQGALSGPINNFSLSSVQKFGDTEFSYTGVVTNAEGKTFVDGDLELKTNNFTSFVRSLNFDYKPDLPVTTFALAGKLKGSTHTFSVDNIISHLGANSIQGNLQFDDSKNTPKLIADLNFDRFDADRLFNLNKKTFLPKSSSETHTFIAQLDLDDQKIDYSSLKDVNFSIQGEAQQLVYSNKIYNTAKINAVLKDGVLKIADFSANEGTSSIDLKFILNTNNVPSIEGSYALKSFNLPQIGGSVYLLEGGQLNADGTFKSLATSFKEFFENIDSRGKFQLLTTAVTGWDLDVIKFELEQRKSVAGFENSILNNLSSGRSIFSSVAGKYEIVKGHVKSDGIIWKSPVVNISMDFDLNLANWLFTSKFNAVYMNASFSDILKFTLSDNMANPTVSVDLSDSIKRISKAESIINSAKDMKEKEQQVKLAGKISLLQTDANNLLNDCSQMVLDIVRFKPVTDNDNVQKVYNTNIQLIQEIERKLTNILSELNNNPDEKSLENIESELNNYRSQLNFIPKSLEDNFVVDGKYVFDDIFNKIAWVYNVAQNNSSYYETISNAYMDRIKLLEDSDNPIDEEKKVELAMEVKSVVKDMDKITALHNKVRENYLSIIDASKISEMMENNDISRQTLRNILSYTIKMDDKIISSIDNFRAVLDISARDYDQYMVYPPKEIEDIDVTKPIVPSTQDTPEEDINLQSENNETVQKNSNDVSVDSVKKDDTKENTEDKKKDDALNVSSASSLSKFSQFVSDELASPSLSFGGLSKFINNLPASSLNNKEESPSKEETIVAAHKTDAKSDEIAPISDNTKEVKEEITVAVRETGEKPIETTTVIDNTEEIVTEEKDINAPSSNITQETKPIKSDVSPIEVVSLNRDKILTDNDSGSSSIINAIDTEIQSFILESPQQQKPIAVNEEVIIADSSSDKQEFFEETIVSEKTTLKTNPVVAMDIGKEQQSFASKEVEVRLPHKSGFKKAKSPVKVENSLTDENSEDNTTKVAINSPKKNKKRFISNSEKAKRQKAISNMALIDILTNEEANKNFVTSSGHLLSNAPVYIEAPVKAEKNQYVYSSNAKNINLFGHVGKQMLERKQLNMKKPSVLRQYVFNITPKNTPIFSGSVKKSNSLYVK